MPGRIPQTFIDDLMARVDIVEIIDARVQLKKAGHEYKACCPFHNEKTPSFTVSPSKQFYHCFGCGAHGTALGFLMEYEHLDFVEAVEDLAHQMGLPVPRESGGADVNAIAARTDLYDLLDEAARFFQRQLREHSAARRAVEYLKGRGVSGEIAAAFGLGFAPPGWDNLVTALGDEPAKLQQLEDAGLVIRKDDGRCYDRFRDRVQFPIRDRRGRVIGFGGRVLGDETPKYLNSPETPVFHKGQELYGLFEARKSERKLERILVVEGYMDVVALAQFGIGNVVATLGTATTREHLEILYRCVPEVIFCFDGDRAGREAAWRALENALPVMQGGRQCRFLFLPDGEDPDTLVRKEGQEVFAARIAKAVPFSEFFYARLGLQADTDTVDGRARLVELARPLLAKLPEGVFRQLMLQELTKLAGASLDRLGNFGAAAGPTRSVPRPSGDRRLNPVRAALRLVLHHPDLAGKVGNLELLRTVSTPGVDILADVIEFARSRPGITTGAILEHWRESENGRHLRQLSQQAPTVPTEALQQEFSGNLAIIIEQSARHQREQRLAELGAKRPNELSSAEKAEYKELVAAQTRSAGSGIQVTSSPGKQI